MCEVLAVEKRGLKDLWGGGLQVPPSERPRRPTFPRSLIYVPSRSRSRPIASGVLRLRTLIVIKGRAPALTTIAIRLPAPRCRSQRSRGRSIWCRLGAERGPTAARVTITKWVRKFAAARHNFQGHRHRADSVAVRQICCGSVWGRFLMERCWG